MLLMRTFMALVLANANPLDLYKHAEAVDQCG